MAFLSAPSNIIPLTLLRATRPVAQGIATSIHHRSHRFASSPSSATSSATTTSPAQPPRPIIPAETPRHLLGSSAIRPARPNPDSTPTSPAHLSASSASRDAFSGPSRPRPSPWETERKSRRRRDLPSMRSKVWLYTLAGVGGLTIWGLFIAHATNAERLSSSVMRQITYQLRNDPDVGRVLGEKIRYAPNWWGFGEPYISGHIQLPLGRVDLKFRVQGSEGAGTVYFTSIRPGEGREFEIVRYKVNADNGEVINLNPNRLN